MFDYQPNREVIICKDKFSMSVQASELHHCTPKENGNTMTYTSVEVGFPNEKEELLMDYAEDIDKPTGTVYPYVPAQLILDVIDKHGGMLSGEIPSLDLTEYKEEE